MSLPPRKLWAFCVSLLMLGLLGGLCDLAGPTERAFRLHRARSARASKPDADHAVPDLTHGSISGSSSPSLVQQTSRQFPVVAGLPVRSFVIHADWVDTPLAGAYTVEAGSSPRDGAEARGPPRILSSSSN
ncbi:MAG: hypothetical protein IT165_14905 [Bryobacterales bacterium]|nr:hypothetical protein [Bryobacterales bacterium]